MKLGDLCNRKVVSVGASAPVSAAAQLMCTEGVGAVVVVSTPADEAVAIGMLTDRDIVCAQLDRPADLGQLRAADIMTGNPLVLNEDLPLEEAVQRLHERRVRRAPVISSSGRLIGVISFDDLLVYVAANLRGLAQLAEVSLRSRVHETPPGCGGAQPLGPA